MENVCKSHKTGDYLSPNSPYERSLMKSIDQSKGYLGHHEEVSNTQAEHREVVGGTHSFESENNL